MFDGPFLIYLTALKKSRREAALEQFHRDDRLKEAKALRGSGGPLKVAFQQLDIIDVQWAIAFVDHFVNAYEHGIDFVINNASIALNDFDTHVIRTTLECNYYHNLEFCHKLLPLLKPGGRLVNVASTAGSLSKYSDGVRNRSLSWQTEADATSIMKDFELDIGARNKRRAGFPSAAYAISKAGLIGTTTA